MTLITSVKILLHFKRFICTVLDDLNMVLLVELQVFGTLIRLFSMLALLDEKVKTTFLVVSSSPFAFFFFFFNLSSTCSLAGVQLFSLF